MAQHVLKHKKFKNFLTLLSGVVQNYYTPIDGTYGSSKLYTDIIFSDWEFDFTVTPNSLISVNPTADVQGMCKYNIEVVLISDDNSTVILDRREFRKNASRKLADLTHESMQAGQSTPHTAALCYLLLVPKAGKLRVYICVSEISEAAQKRLKEIIDSKTSIDVRKNQLRQEIKEREKELTTLGK